MKWYYAYLELVIRKVDVISEIKVTIHDWQPKNKKQFGWNQ